MRHRLLLSSAIFVGLASLTPTAAFATIDCAGLPAQALLSPGVTAASSTTVPVGGSVTVAYCQVNLELSPGDPVIKIRVGLPLTGWNGKVRNTGGGGCVGSVGSVTTATNGGYVGSSTDTGHNNGSCEEAINLDHTINTRYLDNFIYNSLVEQIRWAKRLASMFYGSAPTFNYWDGCSTGGRQGLALAQKAGDELDGILAGAPAFNWNRFQTAQMWGQIVQKDLGVVSTTKQNAAAAAARAACDANDGVTDGVIDDPRTCTYSAAASFVCVANGGTSADANCMTPTEALVQDKIWDGPRNTKGKKIWFATERGGATSALSNSAAPFALGVVQFHWDELDRTFDWHTVTMFGAGGTKSYAQVAQDGSNNIGLLADTTQPDLNKFRDNGGKLLMWQGMSDQLIMPRGSIDYYRRVATTMAGGNFATIQPWFRYFRAPGVGHCAGGEGAQPQNLFNTMVTWRETGVAPDFIQANGGTGAPPTRTRKLCPYPATAVYNGSGSTDDMNNFTCSGNIDTPAIVAADTVAKYKFEAQ